MEIIKKDKYFFNKDNWGKKTKYWLSKYPICLPEYWNLKDKVNPYCFIDTLFDNLIKDDIIVCANGTACVTAFQGAKIKPGQRLFHNSGCASMGYELPAAIGAYFSKGNSNRVICIAGDGSIMMNLQELETIVGNKLNIKIFLINNFGYQSIRQTQQSFFNNNVVGCGLDSGLSFPNFEKISKAFDFQYFSIKNHLGMESIINESLVYDGPTICEIFVDLSQQFSPKLSSRKLDDGTMVTSSLEDMAPFLSREELQSNMYY